MILKRKTVDRPYRVPATLVQRFGGFLLDIGLLIFALIALNILYKLAFDIPLGRTRYIPPHPDDGWSRVLKSAGFSVFSIALMAGFLTSRWQSSPGMQGFHIRAETMSGKQPGFFRAFLWTLLGLLPLLAANYMITVGIALQTPILHLGLINLFSLMLVLQSAFFAPILFRKDKRSLPDLIMGMKVEYMADLPDGLHFLKRIFHFPFLAVFILIMASTSIVGLVNLFDAPLDRKIAVYNSLKSKKLNILRETWRNEASFTVSVRLADFRCASKTERFHPALLCQSHEEIRTFVKEHKELVDAYRESINVIQDDKSRLHDIYLNSESVALTDLMIADLILRYEDTQDKAALLELFKLQNFWRAAVTKPGYMIAQNRALIHYSHTLLALPVFLANNPDIAKMYKDEINEALQPIIFDAEFLDGLMAYEYGLYDKQLEYALIDYFPFMQPNQTRNSFAEAASAVSQFFDLDMLNNEGAEKRSLQNIIDDQYQWFDLYNPLGTRLRDYALQSLQTSGHAISSYHHNNALKQALMLYTQALAEGYSLDTFGSYFETIPEEKKRVLQTIPLLWDEQNKALYYIPPKLVGFQRTIQL